MARPQFDLIVFDYDGVVADSELLSNRVMAEVLTQIGLPTTLDEALASYLGKAWRDCEVLISERLGRTCPPQVHADWTRLCHEQARQQLSPVKGFTDFLAGRDEARCIASSSPPDWIEMGLERFGAHSIFAGKIFSGAVHVERGKPHPDLFLYAAESTKVAPQSALVIEDSPAGVIGAVAAGMTVVGLCAGGHIRDGHAEKLNAAGAHHIFDSYAQIEDWLGS